MIASPARVMLRELSSLAAPLPDFDPDNALAAPQDQFLVWLQDAVAAGIREPHAMTLSTVDAGGRPDARVLILKDVDERGWHFATSRLSPKGQQLASKADAALTFYWPWLGRQIRIRGTSIDLGWVAAVADFWARSPEEQANAALERQSLVMGAEAAQGASEVVELPASWSVSAVRPDSVEFWQGRTDRRHVRLRYERAGEGWTRVRLWP